VLRAFASVRAAAMKPLPVPIVGGSIDELRPFLNYGSADQFILMVSWLIGSFRVAPPFIGLSINGPQNAGKCTATGVLCDLIDPSTTQRSVKPKNAEDLLIAARNSWLPSFDNLSGLKHDLSDALCTVLTDGAVRTRKLYTNTGEETYQVNRPIILNGIPSLTIASDLASRFISIDLPGVSETRKQQFKTNAEFDEAFAAAKPRIFGAILDALSTALRRLPDVKREHNLADLRMGDFAYWACAAAPVLGWQERDFLNAYRKALEVGAVNSIMADGVAVALINFVERQGDFEGLISELFEKLRWSYLGLGANAPRTPGIFGYRLRRLVDDLRSHGIDIEIFPRRGRGVPVRVITVNAGKDEDYLKEGARLASPKKRRTICHGDKSLKMSVFLGLVYECTSCRSSLKIAPAGEDCRANPLFSFFSSIYKSEIH
jgi:putative DNA primase/helicase